MNNFIFSFSKPVPDSTVVSNRIATFLGETLDIPVFYDKQIAKQHVVDILFIVNGAFAFCDCLESLAKAITRAERVVWVQNDYTISPPKREPGAESPFRYAFVERERMGLHRTDYWTTVEKNSHATALSTYINWNKLTCLPKPMKVDTKALDIVLYYGAYRQQRVKTFDRYFSHPKMKYVISSTSKKFRLMYPSGKILHIGGLDRENFYRYLNHSGLGLYIEDRKSHVEFHSPANRFYEMLSAGLPMAFEQESVPMLLKAGIDARPYALRGPKDLQMFMDEREYIAKQQQATWFGPHREALVREVKAAYKHLLRNHT